MPGERLEDVIVIYFVDQSRGGDERAQREGDRSGVGHGCLAVTSYGVSACVCDRQRARSWGRGGR